MHLLRLRTDTSERLRFRWHHRLGVLCGRMDLDLDLLNGTYTWRHGAGIRTRRREGLLRDDLRAITLSKERVTGSSSRADGRRRHRWTVAFTLAGETRPLVVFASPAEEAARRRWLDLARRLHLEAVDTSGKNVKRLSPQDLDLEAEPDQGPSIGRGEDHLAHPSSLGVQSTETEFMVDLPPAGLARTGSIRLLLGLVAVLVGGLVLVVVLGRQPGLLPAGDALIATPISSLLMAGALVVLGAILAGIGVVAGRGHERLMCTRDEIRVSFRYGGRSFGEQILPCRGLADIEVRPRTGRGQAEIVSVEVGGLGVLDSGRPVFTDQRELVFHGEDRSLVCGRGQRDRHLEWIAAALRRRLAGTASPSRQTITL